MIVRADSFKMPLRDECVHCCVTSPPYFGLRVYQGVDPNGYGNERDMDCLGWARGEACGRCFVCHTVAVFREVKRVLHPGGCVFLNIGDSYAANRGYQVPDSKWCDVGNGEASNVPAGLKPKDQCCVPERVKLALQADGWYVRSDIIYAKVNPMPESCADRPTRSYEHVLLLTKSGRYYWDAEAVREPAAYAGEQMGVCRSTKRRADAMGRQPTGNEKQGANAAIPNGRNLRDVFTIPSEANTWATCDGCGYTTERWPRCRSCGGVQPECPRCHGKQICPRCKSHDVVAHYAAFPQRLPEICIKAGSSERGVCAKCLAPWERIVEAGPAKAGIGRGIHPSAHRANIQGPQQSCNGGLGTRAYSTLGWRATCDCNASTVPALILDPFAGSGTTLLVAQRLGRRAVGLEMSASYIRISQARLAQKGLFS